MRSDYHYTWHIVKTQHKLDLVSSVKSCFGQKVILSPGDALVYHCSGSLHDNFTIKALVTHCPIDLHLILGSCLDLMMSLSNLYVLIVYSVKALSFRFKTTN